MVIHKRNQCWERLAGYNCVALAEITSFGSLSFFINKMELKILSYRVGVTV